MIEKTVSFNSNGNELYGILHPANLGTSNRKGVIIVPGGPQTRVGSHRIFVSMARALALQGTAVLRIDCHGIGDSDGEIPSFQSLTADIDKAIAELLLLDPGIESVCLLGLCDGSSASLLYLHDYSNPYVKQLILLNPWVRQLALQAETRLKHYYWQRLRQKSFWLKLIKGNLLLSKTVRDILLLNKQSKKTEQGINKSFVEKMLDGAFSFDGQVDIILSENDLVAKEFELLINKDKRWQQWSRSKSVQVHVQNGANHTFSKSKWKSELFMLIHKVVSKI